MDKTAVGTEFACPRPGCHFAVRMSLLGITGQPQPELESAVVDTLRMEHDLWHAMMASYN